MKKITILVLLFMFSMILLGNNLSDINGSWQRPDGSIYKIQDHQVTIEKVGRKLRMGKFNKKDVKIRNIHYENGIIYALSRYNDRYGNLTKWAEIIIVVENDNLLIQNLDGKTLVNLVKVNRGEKKNIGSKLAGEWKRNDDGSIYKFDQDIAVIKRVGYYLDRGKFKENQIKLRNIKYNGNGNYSALSRINNINGELSRWQSMEIQLNNNELSVKSLVNNRVYYFTKINSNKDDTYNIIEAMSKKIENLEMANSDRKEETTNKKDIAEKNNYITTELDKNIPTNTNKKKYGIAILIANKEYKNNIPNVEYAINDMNLMKQYVISVLGYKEENIITEKNASKAVFETIFGIKDNYQGKLYNWIKANKSDVFIYYAGHGAPDIKNDKAYFVPVDSDPSTIALNGYSVDVFYDNIAKLPYKSLTVVIDACFSGTSQEGLLIKNISPAGIEVSNPIVEIENASIFLSSSGKEYSSWYLDKGHSLFTYYYLKGLQGEADFDKNNVLTVGELRKYIDEQVPYKARRMNSIEQTPQTYGDDDEVIIKY
ncbi:MAG: caspase family protein [Candidatus Marinimicrobia bacterium]|nr:caspase family protein [Candidatus Neomarinimicrobiota bacterium]